MGILPHAASCCKLFATAKFFLPTTGPGVIITLCSIVERFNPSFPRRRESRRTNMHDETTYKLFKAIEANPDTNQRQLASELEMSLGKLNYCLKALLDKGLVKAENFIASNNKRGYLYQLTPAGLSEKAAVTLRFLNYKLAEYKKLKQEIASLQAEAISLPTSGA